VVLRPCLSTGLPFSQQPPCEEMRLLTLINALKKQRCQGFGSIHELPRRSVLGNC
jgi:hypothetical protein